MSLADKFADFLTCAKCGHRPVDLSELIERLAVLEVLKNQETMLGMLQTVITKEGNIMALEDDIKQAVADNAAATTQMLADVEAGIAKLGTITVPAPGVDPAVVKAQVDALTTSTASLRAEAAKLEAVLAPPPAPVA